MMVTFLPSVPAVVAVPPTGVAPTVTVFVSLLPHAATPIASRDAAAMVIRGRLSDIAFLPVVDWTSRSGLRSGFSGEAPGSVISTALPGAARGPLRGRSGPS